MVTGHPAISVTSCIPLSKRGAAAVRESHRSVLSGDRLVDKEGIQEEALGRPVRAHFLARFVHVRGGRRQRLVGRRESLGFYVHGTDSLMATMAWLEKPSSIRRIPISSVPNYPCSMSVTESLLNERN
jgi:hypothetical protein